MLRRWLSPTYVRRRWCMWRGHPMAEWSPWVGPIQYENDSIDPITLAVKPGQMFGARGWRCAHHDHETPPNRTKVYRAFLIVFVLGWALATVLVFRATDRADHERRLRVHACQELDKVGADSDSKADVEACTF